MINPAARVINFLRASNCTLGTAESLTGGALADAIVSVPGASSVFLGGVVAYSNEAKQSLLGVSDDTLTAHGAVSAQVATEMAAGIRNKVLGGATGHLIGVATTGVAGPDSQEGRPVGLVFIAVASELGVTARRYEFVGDRASIRRQAVDAALALIMEQNPA